MDRLAYVGLVALTTVQRLGQWQAPAAIMPAAISISASLQEYQHKLWMLVRHRQLTVQQLDQRCTRVYTLLGVKTSRNAHAFLHTERQQNVAYKGSKHAHLGV